MNVLRIAMLTAIESVFFAHSKRLLSRTTVLLIPQRSVQAGLPGWSAVFITTTLITQAQ